MRVVLATSAVPARQRVVSSTIIVQGDLLTVSTTTMCHTAKPKEVEAVVMVADTHLHGRPSMSREVLKVLESMGNTSDLDAPIAAADKVTEIMTVEEDRV